MPESSFDVFCPECNMLVEAKAIAEGHGSLAGNLLIQWNHYLLAAA